MNGALSFYKLQVEWWGHSEAVGMLNHHSYTPCNPHTDYRLNEPPGVKFFKSPAHPQYLGMRLYEQECIPVGCVPTAH